MELDVNKTALIVSMSILVFILIMLFIGLLCYYFVCNMRKKAKGEKPLTEEAQRSRPPSQQRMQPPEAHHKVPPGFYPGYNMYPSPEMRQKPIAGVKRPKDRQDGRHSAPGGMRKAVPMNYPELRHPAPVDNDEIRRPKKNRQGSPRPRHVSQPPADMPPRMAMLFGRENAAAIASAAQARVQSRGGGGYDVMRHSANDIVSTVDDVTPYAEVGRMVSSGPIGPDILRHNRKNNQHQRPPLSSSHPHLDPTTGEDVYSKPDKRRSQVRSSGAMGQYDSGIDVLGNGRMELPPSPEPSIQPTVPDKQEDLLERYLTEQRTSRESKGYDTSELDTFY